jgi:hypothetical protein
MPAPTLTTITAVRPASIPNVCDVAGGTVVLIVGTNFAPPVTIRVRSGSDDILDNEGKPARGFVWDVQRNLTATQIYAGMPALAAGTYNVAVITDEGTSNEIAVEYRLYAEEHRVLSARQKFAKRWRAGARFLRR